MTYQPRLFKDLIEEQHYGCAIHEAGHAVAAYGLGLSIRKQGIVLADAGYGLGLLEGVAHVRSRGVF